MANYLYKAKILIDTTNAYGFNNSAEASNKSDFDTNFKALCYPVSDLELMSDVFIIEKTYAQFKALIDGAVITWADIKLETAEYFYDLYLLTDTQL